MKGLYPNIELTTSVEAVCSSKEVEAVIIVVPATLHFDVTSKCLAAGKHVLVDKPFTTIPQDGVKLKDLAIEKNLTILVGHTFMYNNRIRKGKELIESGEIGTGLLRTGWNFCTRRRAFPFLLSYYFLPTLQNKNMSVRKKLRRLKRRAHRQSRCKIAAIC